MSATGCRHGREPSTCKECVPSARERWRNRDRRMRNWAASEWQRFVRREIGPGSSRPDVYFAGRPYYRDLPSRRSRTATLGHRADGSAPDALTYARGMRLDHIAYCRRVDCCPTDAAFLYLDLLRAASAPVGLLPG